jgi:hypothetical protein
MTAWVRRPELHCARLLGARSGACRRSDQRFQQTSSDRSCPLLSMVPPSVADPPRTNMRGSGSVRSRTPPALQSSATRDRIGRPGTARPILAAMRDRSRADRHGQQRESGPTLHRSLFYRGSDRCIQMGCKATCTSCIGGFTRNSALWSCWGFAAGRGLIWSLSGTSYTR